MDHLKIFQQTCIILYALHSIQFTKYMKAEYPQYGTCHVSFTSTSHKALLLVADVAEVRPVVLRNTCCFFLYSSMVRNFSCSAWNRRTTSPPFRISSWFSRCSMNRVTFHDVLELTTFTWQCVSTILIQTEGHTNSLLHNREELMKFARPGYGTQLKHVNLEVKDQNLLWLFLANLEDSAWLVSQPPPLSCYCTNPSQLSQGKVRVKETHYGTSVAQRAGRG